MISETSSPASRRSFIKTGLTGLFLPVLAPGLSSTFELSLLGNNQRDFSVCITADAILENPAMVKMVADAGVNRVWIATYFYGYWPWDKEKIKRARKAILESGMEAAAITLPFGHPGDALNPKEDNFPLISPDTWSRSVDIDGKRYAGTTVSPLANKENAVALRELKGMKFPLCILDDDFRIARSPGTIGGNFDDANQQVFIRKGGYGPGAWKQLTEEIRARQLTPMVRAWVNWQCDLLTESFLVQQNGFGAGLGFMAMYLCSEKAGIRFSDYKNVPVRVGEAHFTDKSLATPKGWTDELFSVLFHRRFIAPENAWSETTAFPADAVSAENMAAKLTISTIADVRHTTFMSGLVTLPDSYWRILGPAITKQKELHNAVAGHKPQGPFKHYWGEMSRFVGRDLPYSLWLALGVPFEVIDDLKSNKDGWVFVSDEDCAQVTKDNRLEYLVARPEAVLTKNIRIQRIEEDLTTLWKWRKTILASLDTSKIPYVIEESPSVCAWYPGAKCLIVWNLTDKSQNLAVQYNGKTYSESFSPMGSIKINLK